MAQRNRSGTPAGEKKTRHINFGTHYGLSASEVYNELKKLDASSRVHLRKGYNETVRDNWILRCPRCRTEHEVVNAHDITKPCPNCGWGKW